MFKNKLVNLMFIILTVLTLIGVIAIVVFTQFFQAQEDPGEPTIDEIIVMSYETDEITTNLYSDSIIRAQFVIQMDNEDAREELEKRKFQVESIIIEELADMHENDFRGSDGISSLHDNLGERLSSLVNQGNVVEIYMKKRVIQ